MDNSRIAAFTNIFRELANTSGLYERTRIVPNLTVVNITPTGLSSDYILIQDDEGFYVPALKVPGITYAVNDKVNVLFIKGTEPIAFQHGSASAGGGGGGGGGWPYTDVITVSQTDVDADHSTIAAALAAASTGDIILLDAGTYTLTTTTTIAETVTLMSLDPLRTIITSSVAGATIDITAADVKVLNVKVRNTGSGTSSGCIRWNTSRVEIINCILTKTSGAPTALVYGLYQYGGSQCVITDTEVSVVTDGVNDYAYRNDTADASVTITRGRLNGATKDIYSNRAGSVFTSRWATFAGPAIDVVAGSLRGWYLSDVGDLYAVETFGMSGGVWRHRTDGLRVKELDLPTAYTNASAGDVIHLFPGTYTLASSLTVAKAITIQGDDPTTTIVTNATSSTQTLNITADGVTIRNLTVNHTGAGTTSSAIAWDGDNFTLENVVANKISGGANLHLALFQYGGTGAKLLNVFATASGGATNSYGYYNSIANASAEVFGGKISGTSFDIFSAEAGSTLVVNGASLGNNKISYLGTITLFGIKGAAFVAHKNGTDQTGIVSGNWTKLTFGTELFDRNGDYDAGNSKHLPLIPGNYNYTACALLVAPTDQASIFIAIYKNGTIYRTDSRNASGISNMTVSITAMTSMDGIDDYVEAYIWHNVGVDKTVEGDTPYTYFQGNLVQ